MQKNKLKQIWADGLASLNGWLSIGNPFTAEIMAAQGYDSIAIDVQHGALDYSSVLPMFQAMRASSVVPLARVPWLEPGIIMKVLDAGAYGAAMSSTYNARPLAAEILVDGARSAVVRQRQDEAALLAGQRIPDWLAA